VPTDEGEKVGVDHVGVRRAHAMWKLFVDLQGALPEELRGEQRGVGDRDDLVVVAVHDKRRLLKPGAQNTNKNNLVAPTGFEPVFQP
jgi:hypothetical protein